MPIHAAAAKISEPITEAVKYRFSLPSALPLPRFVLKTLSSVFSYFDFFNAINCRVLLLIVN